MNRVFSFVIILFLAAFSLLSCGGNNEDSSNTTVIEDLLGTWTLSAVVENGKSYSVSTGDEKLIIRHLQGNEYQIGSYYRNSKTDSWENSNVEIVYIDPSNRELQSVKSSSTQEGRTIFGNIKINEQTIYEFNEQDYQICISSLKKSLLKFRCVDNKGTYELLFIKVSNDVTG